MWTEVPGTLEMITALATALVLGALVGMERQWRQRLAGLRTNALVAVGAASFTLMSAMVMDEISPTRVAAQVVSGIGFIGAGVILHQGATVRGLNTAATLWCSAAVGVFAGAGFHVAAVLATGFVIAANTLLRPLTHLINRQPLSTTEVEWQYLVTVTCRADQEAHARALLLQGLLGGDLRLQRLDSRHADQDGDEPGDTVHVHAQLRATKRQDLVVEQVVGRLSLENGVRAAGWDVTQQAD